MYAAQVFAVFLDTKTDFTDDRLRKYEDTVYGPTSAGRFTMKTRIQSSLKICETKISLQIV